MAQIRIYNNKQKVAVQFAEFLVKAVSGRKRYTIALSGGSTPKVVFELLTREYTDVIDWSKIHFFWGDERCVHPNDPESNYGMTAEHLFSKIVIPRQNIHRMKGEEEPHSEARRYAGLLKEQVKMENIVPQFDLVILGMGDDGHTASIFPHEIDLWHTSGYCVVATHPKSGQRRISINGRIINNAASVTFLVTGANKADKVYEIIKKEIGYEQYPAALVNPETGKLIWFLDQDAARRLLGDN